MPKINLNLQFLFREYDVIDRYKKVAGLGFKYVELQNPYDIDIHLLSNLLGDLGLEQILINVNVMDNDSGLMNLAINPDKKDLFKERVDLSRKYAEALSVKVVNCTPGPQLENYESSEQYETLITNLSYAAAIVEECDTKLLIEPINTFDQPGFFISRSNDGAKVVFDTNHNNVGLQYDVYHMQLMEGNIINQIKKHIGIIGHFQIADVPGRLEPGKGEINYTNVFKTIDDLDYKGFVGAEYNPEKNTEEGLSWIDRYSGLKID